jgi:hypothetical protein
MPIFRRPTPKGKAYKPNPEPDMEYTETVHVPKLSRKTRQALGYLPKGKLPKNS